MHLWGEGKPAKVVQVMQQVPGLSSTTEHHRLKLLAAPDFIALNVDEADNRVKYVTPTARAFALNAKRGQMLTQLLEPPTDDASIS